MHENLETLGFFQVMVNRKFTRSLILNVGFKSINIALNFNLLAYNLSL